MLKKSLATSTKVKRPSALHKAHFIVAAGKQDHRVAPNVSPPRLGPFAFDRSSESMSACIRRNKFGFCSGIFSTVQWSNCVDRTVRLSVGRTSEEMTGIGQVAAGAAMHTLSTAPGGNRQHRGTSSFCLRGPGISFFVSHNMRIYANHAKMPTRKSSNPKNNVHPVSK